MSVISNDDLQEIVSNATKAILERMNISVTPNAVTSPENSISNRHWQSHDTNIPETECGESTLVSSLENTAEIHKWCLAMCQLGGDCCLVGHLQHKGNWVLYRTSFLRSVHENGRLVYDDDGNWFRLRGSLTTSTYEELRVNDKENRAVSFQKEMVTAFANGLPSNYRMWVQRIAYEAKPKSPEKSPAIPRVPIESFASVDYVVDPWHDRHQEINLDEVSPNSEGDEDCSERRVRNPRRVLSVSNQVSNRLNAEVLSDEVSEHDSSPSDESEVESEATVLPHGGESCVGRVDKLLSGNPFKNVFFDKMVERERSLRKKRERKSRVRAASDVSQGDSHHASQSVLSSDEERCAPRSESDRVSSDDCGSESRLGDELRSSSDEEKRQPDCENAGILSRTIRKLKKRISPSERRQVFQENASQALSDDSPNPLPSQPLVQPTRGVSRAPQGRSRKRHSSSVEAGDASDAPKLARRQSGAPLSPTGAASRKRARASSPSSAEGPSDHSNFCCGRKGDAAPPRVDRVISAPSSRSRKDVKKSSRKKTPRTPKNSSPRPRSDDSMSLGTLSPNVSFYGTHKVSEAKKVSLDRADDSIFVLRTMAGETVDVRQLARTRSGRLSRPPLDSWRGQKIATDRWGRIIEVNHGKEDRFYSPRALAPTKRRTAESDTKAKKSRSPVSNVTKEQPKAAKPSRKGKENRRTR